MRNENQKSGDYENIKDIFRPSHADFSYFKKYGIRDYRGGGRSSARESVARVIAGAFAKMILSQFGIKLGQVGKNILYSDLGIIAKNGDAGNMLVSVHNLSTARPEKDVSVSVYDFQNQLIERKTTWDDGTVEINVLNKKPYYLIAKNKEHTGYLRLDPSQSLSMSTFDVAGEEVRKGIKGFIYTDRGVWRPGDSIYVTFILNDRDKTLPPNHPVTLELFTPDNQL